MSGITDTISTHTLGTTETVVVKRYGDGTVAYSPILVTSVGTTSGSPNLASVVSTNGVVVGDAITGTGIPAGTTVVSFVANTSVVMSANATATATVNASINKSHNSTGEKRTEDSDPREGWMALFIAALLIVA